MSLAALLARTVHLPPATAVWVLTAHACALLLPLALALVVAANLDYVSAQVDYPVLLFLTAAVMLAGSAFEIAQNSIDRWYLTPDTASAHGKSFCDLLFYWMIVASQALVIVACVGEWLWLTVSVTVVVVLYPWCYPRARLDILPLALLGLGAAAAGYYRFDNPVFLLQLLVTPLVNSLFGTLLKTGAQFLHGFVTLAAASNALLLAWGIASSAAGDPLSWPAFGSAAIAILAIAALVPRATRNLEPTPLPD